MPRFLSSGEVRGSCSVLLSFTLLVAGEIDSERAIAETMTDDEGNHS